MATPVFCCGFECGVSGDGNHFAVIGTGSFSTTTIRSGLRALRLNPTIATAYGATLAVAATTGRVIRVYVYFASLPNTTTELATCGSGGGNYEGAYFNSSDSKIYAGYGSASLGATGIPVTTGVWYQLDIKLNATANPHLIDVSVNGVACGQASNAEASANYSSSLTNVGFRNSSTTADAFFEDWLISTTLTDYPIGAGYILSYIPNADGTHNVAGAADFKHGTGTTPAGTDITNASTDAWQDIDKRPLVTSAAGAETLINMIAPPNATDYVEIRFEASVEPGPPRAVEVIIGINQAGTGAGNMEVRLNDNGTMGTIYTATGVAGVAIATGVVFKRAQFADPPSAASAWVLGGAGDGDFNDLRIRFGSPAAVDANPDQYLVEAMFEAEYQPALPQALYGRPFGQPGVKLMPQLLAT